MGDILNKQGVTHLWSKIKEYIISKAITSDTFQNELKKYISNENTVNTNGYALDARQGNPTVEGSLAKQISKLNEEILQSEFIVNYNVKKISIGNLRVISLHNASSDSLGIITQLPDIPKNRSFNLAIYEMNSIGRIEANTDGKMYLCDFSGASLKDKKNIIGQIIYSVK